MGWLNCARCNETFGLSDETEAVLRRSGREFHCPWGHTQHFPLGKSEAQKLQAALDEERRRRQIAEQRTARYADEAAAERRRANAFKGVATKVRKRAKAGTCPCCNRTFAELSRHMASQHPDFTPEPPEPAATTH